MHCFTQDQIATAWEQMRAILMNEVMERFVRQNLLRVQIMGAIYNFAYLAHLRLCNYALASPTADETMLATSVEAGTNATISFIDLNIILTG